MQGRGAMVWVVLSGLLGLGYGGSYLGLRAAHVLVHQSLWVSEEGRNGRHWHSMAAPSKALETLYAPLTALELNLQQRAQP